MSNTVHRRPTSTLRHQRVQNRRKMEMAVLDQLRDENIISRHVNRINSFWHQIPEPWDDYYHRAWREYANKTWSRNYYRNRYEQVHWTRNINSLTQDIM